MKSVASIFETNEGVTVSRPYLCTVNGIALIAETNTRVTVERSYLCTVKGVALIEETNTSGTVERFYLCTVKDLFPLNYTLIGCFYEFFSKHRDPNMSHILINCLSYFRISLK